MSDDRVAQSKHLLVFSCDLWLQAKEVHTSHTFNSQIEAIKRDTANAKDESALRAITDRFLALTGKLAAQDWKEFERGSAGNAKEVAAEKPSKHKLSKNSRSAALRSF
jgi:hypothetical protein